MLDDTAREFEARGMDHWAIGAAVHAAYWRETVVRGGGTSRVGHIVRDIGARGGEGFAYYLPDVAAWLGRTAEREGQVSALARTIRARAEAAQRRAKTDAGAAVGASLAVTGSFQRSGPHLRITARLVDLRGGDILADAKVDGQLSDVFALQDGIVLGMAAFMVQADARVIDPLLHVVATDFHTSVPAAATANAKPVGSGRATDPGVPGPDWRCQMT